MRWDGVMRRYGGLDACSCLPTNRSRWRGYGDGRMPVNETNRVRLRGLLDVLGVSVASAARTMGISRPLLSRVLAGDDGVDAGRVWGLCERHLPEIVALRSRPFLDLEGAPVEMVQAFRRDAA